MSFDIEKLKPFDEFSSEKSAGVNELVYDLVNNNEEYPIVRSAISSVYIANTAAQILNTTVPPKSVVSVQKNNPSWLDGFTVLSNYTAPFSREYLPVNFSVSSNGDGTHTIYISNPTDAEFVIDAMTLFILRICIRR